MGHKLRKVFASGLVPSLALLCALLSTGIASAQRISSPEERSVPCSNDSQCAALGAGAGEDSRCVQNSCVRGFCIKSYLTGKSLGLDPAPSPVACFISPLVCGSSGQAVLDTNPAKQQVYNENKTCVPASAIHPVCQQATCRNKVCQISNVNGSVCADPNGDICKRGICAAGACASVKVVASQLKKMCKPTETSGCLETSYACAATGCVATKRAKAGVQCASDGALMYRAPNNELPATFLTLLQRFPTQPYSCSESCLLEYCGNNIIDRPEEECDGTAFKQPPPAKAKCEANCTVTKPPACTITAVRDTKMGVTPLATCTITVKSTGGPATSLTVNGGNKGVNTAFKLPCPLDSSTTFSAELTGQIDPVAKCEASVQPACIYSFHENLTPNPRKKYVYEGTITNPPQCLRDKIQECMGWIDKGMANLTPKTDTYHICDIDGTNLEKCKAHTFRACMMYQNGYWDSGLKLKPPKGDKGSQEFLSSLINGLNNKYLANKNIETYPRVFLDSNCNYKGWEGGGGATATCGGVEYHAQSSPISLILEDGYDIEAHQAIVSFPVNLGQRDKLYTWKASSKAPLLVYDPEHTGMVTSATQLFGNWTFGGQRLASREMGTIPTEWENGYAALASLDEDGDGKISGHELKDIALWFDANQNAVTERAEVQSLAQHGITELYFAPDHRDDQTHSISASKGFMRVADGREVYGRSVDWFAAAAESIDPLISHTLVERGGMSTVVKDSLPQEGSPKEAALSQSVGVSGVWEWAANSSLDSSVSEVPNGLLIIGETDGGGISVNSMLLNTTQEISTSENLMLVSLVDMTGSVTLNNGTPELAFSSSPDLQGVSVRSKATMVDNGARLTGFSEAVITGTDGNTKTIRYEWSARRK